MRMLRRLWYRWKFRNVVPVITVHVSDEIRAEVESNRGFFGGGREVDQRGDDKKWQQQSSHSA